MKKTIALFSLVLWASTMACDTAPQPAPNSTATTTTATATVPAELKPALDSMTANDLLQHIKTLASDEYEGRAPGTKGEELTVNYLTEQFKKLGLKPGNPDGTFVQKVPLVGFTPTTNVSFNAGGKEIKLAADDYLARSSTFQPNVNIANSDIVFVGYGVVAPEYGWDDFKGVDVKGKTIVMLVNDPQIPDPSDASKLDDKIFKGKAMTYYGRWTYKYEIASAKGAAAAIIVHEEPTAGYPLKALNSWRQENFGIKGSEVGRVPVEAWLSFDKSKELFAAAGQDLMALKKAALSKDFKPVPLNAKANLNVKSVVRQINSQNVVAKLEGTDAKLKDEYVIYTAHWDHMGRDPKLQGDQIFNGAIDNASGTACLIEWAKAFTKAPTKRSILFLAVTAEEKGLLGAKYYAENPLYPLTKTVANINMDGINQWGKTKDITVVGLGNSTLDDVLADACKTQGRVIKPDPEPEKGYFYRSDHFEFAKQGVPALDPDGGSDYINKPAGYGQQKRDEYTQKDYHDLTDEVKPDWDLAGAVDDLQLLFLVGHHVANGDKWPEWKPGTEFKTKREEMLKKTETAVKR
ncbi:MAG TPA: M28 family metallopeptidase [Blastocatellia bacterium]|nr:M28 family metallopeptidase [Blastocatellia bacterium]